MQVAYYAENNQLLPRMDSRMLWEHFVVEGQFEARPFRFRCSEDIFGQAGRSGGSGSGRLRKRKIQEPVTPDSLVTSALKGAQGLLVGNAKP